MNESQISVRYAKALFQSASEKGILERVFKDMEMLSEICKIDDFQYMITLPSLPESQKMKMVDSIMKSLLSGISMAMIHLVIKNRREIYFKGIARNFSALYRKSLGIRKASLRTAQPMEESAIKNLRELIKKAYDAEVELSLTLDEEMIGGFVLTIDDMQYDASVTGHLRHIKKQLLQTSVEKK